MTFQPRVHTTRPDVYDAIAALYVLRDAGWTEDQLRHLNAAELLGIADIERLNRQPASQLAVSGYDLRAQPTPPSTNTPTPSQSRQSVYTFLRTLPATLRAWYGQWRHGWWT